MGISAHPARVARPQSAGQARAVALDEADQSVWGDPLVVLGAGHRAMTVVKAATDAAIAEVTDAQQALRAAVDAQPAWAATPARTARARRPCAGPTS